MSSDSKLSVKSLALAIETSKDPSDSKSDSKNLSNLKNHSSDVKISSESQDKKSDGKTTSTLEPKPERMVSSSSCSSSSSSSSNKSNNESNNTYQSKDESLSKEKELTNLSKQIPEPILKYLIIHKRLLDLKSKHREAERELKLASDEIMKGIHNKSTSSLLLDVTHLSPLEASLLGHPGYLELSVRTSLRPEAPKSLNLQAFKECVYEGLMRDFHLGDIESTKKRVLEWEKQYMETKYGTGDYYIHVPTLKFKQLLTRKRCRKGLEREESEKQAEKRQRRETQGPSSEEIGENTNYEFL